jgi:hypothetical protein
MLMQAGIIYTAEDRTATRFRVYVGLTQGEPSSPTLYNLSGDCLLVALTDASRLFSVCPLTTTKTHEEQVSEMKTSQELVRCATVRPMETARTIEFSNTQERFEGGNCIGRERHVGEVERNALVLGKPFLMLQPGVCPPAGGFQLWGEELQVVRKVKCLGMVVHAEGDIAASLRGRVRTAMA